ncbi:glycosyltransferase [Microbacterium abyssi]|uniref:glycosyltransferase n=1 Tax=Microbacterium abyssi TaxID=2782166 RepID=UPI001886FA11|nr:glycosyltransferase [Microbacterium sp. A18JL241]
MTTTSLPHGRQFTLAWTIPDEIGGLTSAMLHRSRAFAKLPGVSVDVLTFDDRVDYPRIEDKLRERGEFVDAMHLVNLWDWLRENDVPRAKNPVGSPERAFTPLATDPAYRSEYREARELHRVRLASDGKTVLQTDHYRADGSLLASNRQDTDQRGTLGGRSVVICDRRGEPVRSWGTTWSLYRYWLDRLTTGDGACFLIADSKPVSRFLRSYRRPDRTTVTVVHGSHLAGNIGPWGRLRPSRAEVIRHLDQYDAVVFLTERQRRDVQLRFGSRPNLCVIPNSRSLPAPFDHERPVGRGILLGALSGLKRPTHAVRAALLARRFDRNVTLDIYGNGPRRAAIDELIISAGATDAVRVHGYQASARDQFEQASFLLLTSRSEGFGLVLLEAMGAGCIPIAYNIRYGPADLIENRRNGFLVTTGNIAGLARAILKLQRMPQAHLTQMRQAARRTAERYTDEAVLDLWARELAAARERNASDQGFNGGDGGI